MNFDIHTQTLLLDGRRYAPAELLERADREGEALSPAERDLMAFLRRWFDDSPYLTVRTSGSTGAPKEWRASKERMMRSARMTCERLGLRRGDTALLCMNLRYIGAMMVVVRSLVAELNLIVRPASSHPMADVDTPPRFAAMVPMQVRGTLSVPEERRRLERTGILIIGGGAVDDALLEEVRRLPGAVYSTYGMTETLSHVALRRLNGASASPCYYPFPSVSLSLAPDGTLVIDAPQICPEPLRTNDIARLLPDGGFLILGRKDNVINSGGVKIQAEEVERALRPLLACPFAVTAVPDERLGQTVALLTEREPDPERMREVLPPYHRPRRVFIVPRVPLAGNGKIDRAACRRMAEELLRKASGRE